MASYDKLGDDISDVELRIEGGNGRVTVNFGMHYLLVHNVALDDWCERYDLRPFTGECTKCGRALSVSKPFIAKERRGLCAETCVCGNCAVPFTFIDFSFPCAAALRIQAETATVLAVITNTGVENGRKK